MVVNFLKSVAAGLTEVVAALRLPVEFVGAVSREIPVIFRRKGVRWCDFRYYLALCGSQSLPIVLLITMLMGGVLGLQAALQLTKFGTEIFVVDLVGFSVLKEFGPLMVAIIATGRAGSAFAAELGTMKVNEEISALETMGVSPVGFLVIPKVLALCVALPLLTIFGDVAGIFGGMCVGVCALKIPITTYFSRTCAVLDCVTLLLGILKSFMFAIFVAVAGCYCGFSASGDAQGVGRGATKAVVSSLFLVIIVDAIMTMLYSLIGR